MALRVRIPNQPTNQKNLCWFVSGDTDASRRRDSINPAIGGEWKIWFCDPNHLYLWEWGQPCTRTVRIPNNNPKGNIMYLTTGDLLAVMIALVVSVTLVITTALANAKLTASRDEWRKAYYAIKGKN